MWELEHASMADVTLNVWQMMICTDQTDPEDRNSLQLSLYLTRWHVSCDNTILS